MDGSLLARARLQDFSRNGARVVPTFSAAEMERRLARVARRDGGGERGRCTVQPMITIPEGMPGAGGYREHDVLVVTGDGNRNITGFPCGPEHMIVR